MRHTLRASYKDIHMTQKIKFKRYRGLVESFGSPQYFPRKITHKQGLLLQKLGSRRKKKLSYFGQNLQSKRLFSLLYGNLRRKHFVFFLKKASQLSGSLSANFLSLLERRLDIVVYRMFQFRTLESARQYILHGGILLNGLPVNLSSLQIQPGDLIQIHNAQDFFSSKLSLLRNGATVPQKTEKQEMQSNAFKSSLKKTALRPRKIKYSHFEINFKLLVGIFLFSPRQLYYPFQLKKEDFIPKNMK
uniref:Ribosomal protein S4 n=1 Tax=Monomastix sp. (strain OKE-1) TaxID=141716 RepID=U5YEQ4_MONSK|nr:ribosomal protein S4 [Monomastix sp. OKE-1]AGZ90192.1 ribosomal protein S4 [Monomastix sp. OKE-1]